METKSTLPKVFNNTANKQTFLNVFLSEVKNYFNKPRFCISLIVSMILGGFLGIGLTYMVITISTNFQIVKENLFPEHICSSIYFTYNIFVICFSYCTMSALCKEFGDNSIKSSLLVVPNRMLLFASKILTWTITAFCAALILGLVNILYFFIMGYSGGITSDILTTILLACFSSSLIIIVVAGIAFIGRATNISFLIFVFLFFIGGTICNQLANFAQPPISDIINFISNNLIGHTLNSPNLVVSDIKQAWINLGVTSLWSIAGIVLGFLRFKKYHG